ncbi:MAG: hypothetical protein MRJ67_10630 [Nitrospirales bacterium]|nr:hypothetical protein [Nitrospirales bacterium]
MTGFSVLLGVAFIIGIFTFGVFCLFGIWQNWPSFINPPDDEWYFYSQSFIKKILGQKGLIICNYGFGILCILASLFGLFNGVRELMNFS